MVLFSIFATNIGEMDKIERDIEDFLKMLHQCEGILYKICLMFTDRRPESVNDLYQEIAYNLWRSYRGFRRESAESTWVYGVALNVARHKRRIARHRPQLVRLDPALADPIADAADNEQVNHLYELIDLLPPDDKALVLLYLEGWSVKEMALMLKRPESTTKKRILNIKQKLRELYEQEN